MPVRKNMTSPHQPQRWEKLGHTVQTHTRIFDVLSVRYRHPVRKTERDFFVIDAPDWVNVIALTPDHRLVLVRQFRFGTDEFSLEIPGGVIDAGEDPVVAGLRELREESGFSGARARLIQRAAEIAPEWLDGIGTIGVTAGASAPEVLVREVIDRLAQWRTITSETVTTAEEHMVFKLPRQLTD